jgi:putative Mg2+ transporter-C (MgtC) family protein
MTLFDPFLASLQLDNLTPHLLALIVAYLLALPIGWDREHRERSAGIRTFPLVAIASCGFIQAAETHFGDSDEALARVTEGIIAGMGFIGGGAILRMKTSVRGTATAASLWATGATGVAVGLGSYDIAILVSAFTFITLRLLTPLKVEQNGDLADELNQGPNQGPATDPGVKK